MQQRLCVLSLALLSTICAGSTALAGPLSLAPQSQSGGRAFAAARGAVSPQAATDHFAQRSLGAPAFPETPRVRHAAAQGTRADMGGGFLELLFRGPAGGRGGPRYEQAPAYYRYPGEPADLGPGMVESPYSPGRPVMDPRYVTQEVPYEGSEAPGTVIIDTRGRFLYLVQSAGTAIRYGIGVGRPGFTWSGVHHISQKREWPDWVPPAEMLRRRPDLPRYMRGGPDNPLGARAMYLGSTLYRIHGSNEPWTIGTAVSSGCIRMRNEDVVDLYSRVKVGTKVVVI
jgi:lipoprotein-anchoring transpeptidase ErfK/SrfK